MPGINAISNKKREIIAVIASLVFVIAGMAATAADKSLVWFLPAFLAVIVFALVSVDKLLLVTVFFVPLSVQLSYFSAQPPFDVSLPTEPVLALLLLIVLFKLFVTHEFSPVLLKHPVSVVILIYLIWTLVTSLTSEMPLVSFKALFYRLWFTASFYLLAAQIFLKKENFENYILAYSLGFAVVIVYFLVKTGGEGLISQQTAYSACYPFFKDHTSFGAAQAFCIPPLMVMFFDSKRNRFIRWVSFILFALLAVAIIFSYSRAAWVSLLASLAIAIILCLRIPRKVLLFASSATIVAIAMSAGVIWQRLDNTTEDSSGDLKTHLKSASNISTDQSNLERINRWKSAYRMFEEQPAMGWGPGTYQFLYAPFQFSGDKTEISTDFGDAGNSHSEYLGALSETGLPGALIFCMIIVLALLAGLRALYKNKKKFNIFMIIAVIAGLLTYVIHGVMNSFLDTDKIAALFWGYIAILTALDIKCREENAKEKD